MTTFRPWHWSRKRMFDVRNGTGGLGLDLARATAAREAAPPTWKVRMVSWRSRLPIDWAAMTPDGLTD